MPVLLFKSEGRAEPWLAAFAELMPDLEVRLWPNIGRPDQIDYAYLYQAPAGFFTGMVNLKAVFSLGAGVDHILADPSLPRQVPISRVVDPELTQRMIEYVVLAVLYHHRRWPEILANQHQAHWRPLGTPAAGGRRVGIMGLGQLGQAAAAALAALGFNVAGWARMPSVLPRVETFDGADQLAPFLARSDILVCLLPLTPATAGILNAATFAALPSGAAVINCARGGHLVEADLLAALDGGRLSGATLDVFETEPLPPDHPFWHHPNITVTPHVASLSSPLARARLVVDSIRRVETGRRAGGVATDNPFPLRYTLGETLERFGRWDRAVAASSVGGRVWHSPAAGLSRPGRRCPTGGRNEPGPGGLRRRRRSSPGASSRSRARCPAGASRRTGASPPGVSSSATRATRTRWRWPGRRPAWTC